MELTRASHPLFCNEPIPYRWTLGWDEGMVSPRPTVNRLLKAMIEKNANEMERLFQGVGQLLFLKM